MRGGLKRRIYIWLCCCPVGLSVVPIGRNRLDLLKNREVEDAHVADVGNSSDAVKQRRLRSHHASHLPKLVAHFSAYAANHSRPINSPTALRQWGARAGWARHWLGIRKPTDGQQNEPGKQEGTLLAPWEWRALFVVLAIFTAINYYVLYRIPVEQELNYLKIVAIFIVLAALFNASIYWRLGEDLAMVWFAGYLEETVFSLENIFVFHAVITRFATPPRNTTKALIWTVHFQILFQSVCFLGLADFLKSLWWLPNVLGVWLFYMGISSVVEEHHVEDVVKEHVPYGKPLSESVEQIIDSPLTHFFQWSLGERFWPHYLVRHKPRVIFFNSEGKWRCTMLAPLILSLVLVDFCFEADVTVAKIEAIENHYVGFSSSVLAAFALPEMYFIVRVLFEHYFLLKYGISFILMFFGVQLLIENLYEIPPMVGVCIVVVVMALCVFISALLSMGPGVPIAEETDALQNSSSEEEAKEAEGVTVLKGLLSRPHFAPRVNMR